MCVGYDGRRVVWKVYCDALGMVSKAFNIMEEASFAKGQSPKSMISVISKRDLLHLMSIRPTSNVVPLNLPICVVLLDLAYGSKYLYLIVKPAQTGGIAPHYVGPF